MTAPSYIIIFNISFLFSIEHVRVNVNPLAADDHMKEVIQQLQLMGEVIYVKGSVCVDVIVLQPKWLSSNVIGHLASPDFIRKSRSSGFYTSHELKSITSWEAVESILPILESLGLCAKVSYCILQSVLCQNDKF